MKEYEFELHRKDKYNEIIVIVSTGLITAYHKAWELYPDVMGIVSTNPTIDM